MMVLVLFNNVKCLSVIVMQAITSVMYALLMTSAENHSTIVR